MRDALINELDNHALTVPVDVRLADKEAFPATASCTCLCVGSSADFQPWWCEVLQRVDHVWPIAPETEGILASISREIAKAGPGKLLGSAPETVALAADKLLTYRHLRSHGIACVPTWNLSDFSRQVPPPWVIKPKDGVGCEGVRKIMELPCPEPSGDDLIQPFIEGEVLSLSVLCDRGDAVLLAINRQLMEERKGSLHLTGCLVNTLTDHAGSYQGLCQRIATALPGLWGYVGVDLIVRGGCPLILEINPRLTLSYVGLSHALGENVANLILALKHGDLCLDDIAQWRKQIKGMEVWVPNH